MHHILQLNQSAIDQHLAGGNVAWSLNALHKAEWIRCRLADELAAMSERRMASCNFEAHLAGFSHSDGDAAAHATAASSPSEEPRKKKYPQCSRSFSNDRQQDRHQATHPPP